MSFHVAILCHIYLIYVGITEPQPVRFAPEKKEKNGEYGHHTP